MVVSIAAYYVSTPPLSRCSNVADRLILEWRKLSLLKTNIIIVWSFYQLNCFCTHLFHVSVLAEKLLSSKRQNLFPRLRKGKYFGQFIFDFSLSRRKFTFEFCRKIVSSPDSNIPFVTSCALL